jgi:rare lipoprotein A
MRALVGSAPLLALLALAGCATSRSSTVQGPHAAHVEQGLASWYGPRNGSATASGEGYRATSYTAAHRALPFGTRVLVENLHNHRRTLVRINDRGPYARGRILDVSVAAARALDMMEAGVVPVRLIVVP